MHIALFRHGTRALFLRADDEPVNCPPHVRLWLGGPARRLGCHPGSEDAEAVCPATFMQADVAKCGKIISSASVIDPLLRCGQS